MADDPNQPFTLGDACWALRLSEEQVRRLADAGVLPCERTPGGYRIFRRSAVEELAAERAAQRRGGAKP